MKALLLIMSALIITSQAHAGRVLASSCISNEFNGRFEVSLFGEDGVITLTHVRAGSGGTRDLNFISQRLNEIPSPNEETIEVSEIVGNGRLGKSIPLMLGTKNTIYVSNTTYTCEFYQPYPGDWL